MSEELIKRLRFMGDPANGSVDHRTIREAADALSRPAPAVQVPDELLLIESVLKGYPASFARNDALAAIRRLLAAAPAPATVATEAVAQGGGVDVEKVMGLVEEYGGEMKDLGQHTAEGYALGIMQDKKEAVRVHAQIRALLTPATCKEVLQVAGWIPVGERLPLDPDASVPYREVDVLATDGRDVHQMRFMGGHIGGPGAWVCWESEGYFTPSKITHWQPLPPPPPAIANQEEGKV